MARKRMGRGMAIVLGLGLGVSVLGSLVLVTILVIHAINRPQFKPSLTKLEIAQRKEQEAKRQPRVRANRLAHKDAMSEQARKREERERKREERKRERRELARKRREFDELMEKIARVIEYQRRYPRDLW